MNKNIRRLIESLFDDDFDDIIDNNDISQNSKLIGDKITSTDILKPLFDKVEDRGENHELREKLLSKDNLIELSNESHKVGGLNFSFIRISLYKGNVESFKELFDILYEYDILIHMNVLEFTLENNTDNVYSLKDLLDLSKYNNLTIKEFVVDYGRLKDLQGFPVNIEKNIEFNWIKYIGSMKGFPETKYYIKIVFENSPMPHDWIGCPSILYGIEFNPNIPDADKLESIKNDIGTLNNIPYDLTFKNNNPNLNGRHSQSCIIDKYWNGDYKKEIKQYIVNCLKGQYNKSIMSLANKLCKQY